MQELITQLGMGGAFVWLAREYRRERKAREKERKEWRSALDELTGAMQDLRAELRRKKKD
jgi:CHASE3 domain sensor protein